MDKDSLQSSIEQKYVFVNQEKDMILEWLEYCYIRDPDFPFGPISSVYYDTPGLYFYQEKRNSDYLKTKIRLRWYANLEASDSDFPVKCYLETKQKYGALRRKERVELTISSRRLSTHDLFSDEEILNLSSRVYELRIFPPGMLVPILLIQYNRYRFVDPRSGSRIALDTDICSTCANPQYIAGFPPITLGMGVLEIKGKHRKMLNALHPISDHLTKEAFSKYARCCEHLMQPFGQRL
ncbi:MAG: VTC domain-containing protein [Planctomycetes bacterium]|nr:VTC domain-containing protein [Planctomycetota bacterium]